MSTTRKGAAGQRAISEERRRSLLGRLDDGAVTLEELARQEDVPLSDLRVMLGLGAPVRIPRVPAVQWDGAKLTYSARTRRWGSALWRNDVREAARLVSATHRHALQLYTNGQDTPGLSERLSRARDTLQAPTRAAAVHAALAASLIQHARLTYLPILSPQQRATLLCLAAGATQAELAQILGLTTLAARDARTMLLRALDAATDGQAISHGWAVSILHAQSQLPPMGEMRTAAQDNTPLLLPGQATPVQLTAHALITNADGHVLMVQPRERKGRKARLRLPGGSHTPGESPRDVAERAAREEVSLVVRANRLLAVDWVEKSETGAPTSVHVYDCGVPVSDDPALRPTRTLHPTAPVGVRWVPPRQLEHLCHRQQAFRISAALQAKGDQSLAELHLGGYYHVSDLA
ncbi:NUDIX domain-containing protein [Streptomyces lydicus]|uniref:NUDIX domain-containing protein n=1 Tax=Streptomyces lydicus TaxID=47763 RepID=UPI0013E9355B|nr:NUDIX hydrolase [Streptomyces lydicus]MCZ1012230.1 NUDIX hydrolase [Streptomyces lydicus]